MKNLYVGITPVVGLPRLWAELESRKRILVNEGKIIFPDRWLVPGDAQNFHDRLKNNPDAAKFGRVYVVTHQPYVLGSCLREQVWIIRKQS